MQHDATWCSWFVLKTPLAWGVFFTGWNITGVVLCTDWSTAPNISGTSVRGGEFKVTPSQEDGHTAIEQYITETLGDWKNHGNSLFNHVQPALIFSWCNDICWDPLETLNPKPWGIQLCQEQFANPLHLTWNTPRNHGLVRDLPSGNLT